MRIRTLLLLMSIGLEVTKSLGQTTINPDISAIGDARFIARDKNAAYIDNEARASFTFEELELALTGYLNPYARSDVYISFDPNDNSVEVEEANATVLRGLPWSLQFKFGKYLLDVGKINTQHPHQWAWLEIPLMHRNFLGEEGARVVGANISTLKAIGDNALTISFNAFDSGFLHENASDGSWVKNSRAAFSGRTSLFRSLTDYTSLETGISFMHATYEPSEELAANLLALDLKLKWRPDMYRAAIFVLEAMLSSRDLPKEMQINEKKNKAPGLFAACDVKWRRRFDGGAFIDYSSDAVEKSVDTFALGAFFGFMPAEETTRFSLVWRGEVSDSYKGSNNSITFQVLWSLGPHKPHPF